MEIQAAELMHTELGQNGGMLIADTTAHTGRWRKMIVIANAAFTTLTTEYTKNDATTPAVAADWGTLSAGTVLYGKFTAVTLSDGSVLMLE